MVTRINGRNLSFTIDGVEYNCNATSIVLDNEEADGGLTTFCDVAAGGSRTYFFSIKGVFATDANSLWTYLWDNTGDTVNFVLKPHGNPVATADKPHFTGSVIVGPKPPLGGDAGDEMEFETRLDLTGAPVKVTTGGA